MLEDPQWRAWLKAVRKRYKARLIRPDVMLAGFSAIALTRAVIYIFPSAESITFPPDAVDGGILIPGLAYGYGIVWLVCAGLGFYAAFEHRLKWLARMLLGMIFWLWAILYTIAGITIHAESTRLTFGWAALFALLGVMVVVQERWKKSPSYFLIPAALVERMRHDKPSPIELVAELYKHSVSEEDLLSMLEVDWRL